ncbi:TORTIFOLIA1-like protein 4 [Malania oleifera]|uniref:TORTIFOLIA1-like protein 4 n=1 Tax=Malania oleifera TaxID=397392 RepID=UPI0025ADECE8|nr:TORTIFOLIA1-like protein 4 [Malania oleifera]
MALHKTANSTRDLKQRVIACLNKLSDRDTLAGAAAELESIARTLTSDSFAPFLSCINATDSSEKSPVRRQCVRLLAFLSHTHGDAMSPFLSKMLAAVARRLRDTDTAVRSACVDAVSAMSSQITKPPFSAFLKPLSEAVMLEQDYNSQIGSAMCLAAAIEASPDPEPAQLSKIFPRLLKLAKSECFKAKPALLSLIGSIVGAGGAASRNVVDGLIPCLVEYLSSEDWAARKAAAEALGRVAALERDLVLELRSTCLASLESRRFDKVKVVRETMNRTLELWKEVPGVSDDVLLPSQTKSSSKDNGSGGDGCTPPVSKNSDDVGWVTPEQEKAIPTKKSPSDNSSVTPAARSPLKSNERKISTSLFHSMDQNRSSDCKIEVAMPHSPCEDDSKRSFGVMEPAESRSRNLRPEVRRALFNKIPGERGHKFGGLRSGSRVVPFYDNDNSDLVILDCNCTEEMYGNEKDIEDLSLIRKQLVQIENQQSSLLDLLQRFIGSSQSGISSLETRVHGLEMALDEISYDLAISTGRISNTDSAGNTCCKLPGAEFLSSKFWRRTEVRHSSSRLSSGGIQSLTAMRDLHKDASTETSKMGDRMFQCQNADGFAANQLADICSNSRGHMELNSNRTAKNTIHDNEKIHVRCGGVLGGASRVNSTGTVNINRRSSA